MLENDTGILSAATAFGKTVVCSKLIAERKVNTLILLESSALIKQWFDALQKFLDIREELPEYQIPSGRTKKRKSVIGRIHGAHDSSTGIIDIAMVGSLCKKGEFHSRLQEYGMVIMATPVSWKGIVEQYAGRLDRDYAGKKNVVIYDDVDSHIDKFDKMYGKRLKAYK